MANEIVVSVIIPMYGRSIFIEDALRSVLEQTHPHTEIILIDDNGEHSSEQNRTYSKIEPYLGEKVKYIKNQKNSGVSASRNNGVEQSSGQYVTFLDDDDIYYPEKIETQLEFMLKNELDISICSFDRFDSEGKTNPSSAIQPPLDCARDLLTRKSSPHAPTLMLKRELYRSIGGFPTNLAYREDIMLVTHALVKGAKLGSIPTPLFNYRVHSGFRLSKKHFPCNELHEIYKTVNETEAPLLATLPLKDQKSIRLKRAYKHANTLYRHKHELPAPLVINVMTLALSQGKWKILAKTPVKYLHSRLRKGHQPETS